MEFNNILNHDPSMIFDDQGRLVRWVRKHEEPLRVPRGCCGTRL